MSLAPAALAALRASAEQGMREDAQPAHAEARERLLQLYRDAWVDTAHLQPGAAPPRGEPMGEADIAGVEWVARLAASGHVPAAAFLERVLEPVHIEGLLAAAPARVEALATQVPALARNLAWKELFRPQPDLSRLDAWLPVAGGEWAEMAAALAELRGVAGAPVAEDFARLRGKLARHRPGHLYFDPFSAPSLLIELAGHRPAGMRRALLERAVELGSDEALDAIFVDDFNAATVRGRFLEEWFAAGRAVTPSSRRPCLQVAMALERRAGDPAPAIPWYERAISGKARKDGAFGSEFCAMVAYAMDKYSQRCLVADGELAMRWFARAADQGDMHSLDAWLKACAEGARGLVSDPQAALERVRRFLASGADPADGAWRLAPSLAAIKEAAARETDAARAQAWREALALIEPK